MSDIQHLSSLPPAIDPTNTQVLVRTISASGDFRALGAEATSCSIIMVDRRRYVGVTSTEADDAVNGPVDHGVEAYDDIENPVINQIIAEQGGAFRGIRPEVLVVTRNDRPTVRSKRSARSRQPYRLRYHAVPDDCLCTAIVSGVEHASNEFIVVPRFGPDPLTGLPVVLGHMWMEGADMAVIATSQSDLVGDELISALPKWLGLVNCDDAIVTVVMRRWFAKWIFNEIDQMSNPTEELADRIRLLESTVLVINWADI